MSSNWKVDPPLLMALKNRQNLARLMLMVDLTDQGIGIQSYRQQLPQAAVDIDIGEISISGRISIPNSTSFGFSFNSYLEASQALVNRMSDEMALDCARVHCPQVSITKLQLNKVLKNKKRIFNLY